jgi:predicted amidohydrolase
MVDMNLRISLLQFDIAWENPEANITYLDQQIDELPETDLIILPEMWSTGFSMQPEKVAEPTDGPSVTWMIRKANEKNAVLAGSLSTRQEGRFVNRFYLVYPDGHIKTYDKKHLFSFGKEDQHYSAGHTQLIADVLGWKIMPIICYDLRFPVWCRNTADYDLLIVVANWPAARIHHWDALIRARAIENQCYVAAVNRTGTDGNGLVYNGHSGLTDMNGEHFINMGETLGKATFTLEKSTLADYRNHFRFLQDRDSFTF